jgi:transcriptional regulator GlxA family with amidase domain
MLQDNVALGFTCGRRRGADITPQVRNGDRILTHEDCIGQGGQPIEAEMRSTIMSSPAKLTRGGLTPRTLRRVQEYIETNLEGTVSIVLLAGVACLSPFHFARAFKQSTGVTPRDYLIQRRVERARELLADTNLPISEIAVATGFADQSHCARRFREHVGLSPRDYRWLTR